MKSYSIESFEREKMIKKIYMNLIVILLSIPIYAATLTIPDTTAVAGSSITIPVYISDTTTDVIAGCEIVLSYDTDILTVTNINNTSMTANFIVADSIADGRLAISLACSTGISDVDGKFLEITCQVSAGAETDTQIPISFYLVNFYDEEGGSVPVTYNNGSITVKEIEGKTELQVLPNPFTPNNDGFNDRVQFQLIPNITSNHTDIELFDISGKRVRKIEQESTWDGRDDDGQNLKPGVYIYILKVNGKTEYNGTVTLIR